MTTDTAADSVARLRRRPTPDAAALYRRGVDQVNAGRYVPARRSLTRAAAAARELGDVDLEARIAGTTGYLLAISSDADDGERLCREALALRGISPGTVAILQGQLGSIEMSRGRLESATEWLGRSIRGLSDDPVRAANMRMNRALVAMDRGEFAAARADLDEAERAYLEAGDVLVAAQAVHNSGYVSMLEGDVVRALQTMERVRAPIDAESELWAATNESDRALALRDAGLITEAETSLANVARVFGSLRAVREQADAEYELARSLLRHAPSRAAKVAAAAARRFRRVGSDARALRAEAVRLRALLAAGSEDTSEMTDGPRRLPPADEVATTAHALDAHGLRGDAAALRLADRLARLRRTGVDPHGETVRVAKGLPLEVTLMAYELRSRHARGAGREGQARRQAARGVELLESSRQTMGSLELQGASGMLGRGLLAEGLSSAVRSGRPDVVFDWSERARHMSLQVVPLRPPPDEESAAELAELRMIRAAHPDGDWLADPRAAALRDRARERQWSHTGTAAIHERVGLDEARAALDDGDAVVSFVYDGRELVALVATQDRTEVSTLDWTRGHSALAGLRSDLDMAAAVRSGPLASVVQESLDDRLAALSSFLLAPIAAAIGDARRVVVAVPGVLSGVPWTMLPGACDRAVTMTPSISRWVRERGAEPWRTRSVGFAVGPHVRRGDEEIARAASAWASDRVLSGAHATVDAVAELAAEVDILHVAAHGRHSLDNPQFSALELADGALFGYDIDRMPHVPQTVVLSACELGRSSVRWGEETVGMTRAWLHAGARCVVASPVVVSDDVACDLLGAMHERLAAGEVPSSALARAVEETGIVAPFLVHGTGF
ncbi:CHAT domain-containing protein [Microbacterium sp. SS28]|uniref:CHAT domain-containing protein n=1 Tax=Microbacterium sp. SS28 TaxID=2919948 RepID=UPI001FA99E10|nr:CHAT domain-containing protein [Microbacterium sp. SS28]